MVQGTGAGVTDLIPRHTQDTGTLERAIRLTAGARLEAAGLGLDAVGNQYYATALAVTGRKRSAIGAAEHVALSKAVGALGWRAPELALLCIAELSTTTKLDEPTLATYVRALNAQAVILLERDLFATAPRLSWTQVAICDDFFGSLDDQRKKRDAWIQMQPARRLPALAEQ